MIVGLRNSGIEELWEERTIGWNILIICVNLRNLRMGLMIRQLSNDEGLRRKGQGSESKELNWKQTTRNE